ncbi:MAG: hypothetical protein O7B99_06265, partial [Planctomycetota bacterium]|nr:hypothetical protein [Planctomycetota bacterium]
EEVPNLDLNIEAFCGFKTSFDGDMIDVLPVWADFAAGPTLDFDGQGYALVPNNAGIVQARSLAFYRVSEAADGIDYNNDGDMNDPILFRNPLTLCSTTAMATSSGLIGPVIVTDERELGAAFFADEAAAGKDLNDDGDVFDVVARYFLLL